MKKKSVTFTILKSEKDGQFFCHVKHGTVKITFHTENHKNHVDVGNMVSNHIEAIRAGRFKVVDAATKSKVVCSGATGEAATAKACRCKKPGRLNRNWP